MLAMVACMLSPCAESTAQRARFPDFFQVQSASPATMPPTGSIINQPPATLQQPNMLPPQRYAPGNAGNVYQANPLPGDAGALPVYQANPIPGNNIPGNFSPPNMDPFASPSQPFPVFPTPQANNPQLIAPQPTYNPPPQFGQPSYGANPGYNAYPNQYQGTNSNWLPDFDWSRTEQAWRSFKNDFLPRLFERPRVRYSYLSGGNGGNELNINDIEFSSTLFIPNFGQSNQPLRISPGFIFHFWDGPNSAESPGFDLPAQAYSGYVSFDHLTNPANQFGLETNLTVGFYSDFENYSSDGLRLTGRLIGWSRINSYTVGKFGVEYFDRVDVKLLPAFGVFMTPTPDIKLDLFFPRSKLSHRVPNFNAYEGWVYVGGEYGGGSWAIERADGSNDQVDINDVRAFLGLEFRGPRRHTGFIEAGYVFEREIVYRSNPLNTLDLQDTFMFRTGIAF